MAINLLGNAVRFTSRGSVVLRVFAVAQTPRDVTLHFEVTDTGTGVSMVATNSGCSWPSSSPSPGLPAALALAPG